MQDDPRLLFMFIGGGHGKREVDDAIAAHHPANIASLPYQPLDQLHHSLSAADLHVVTLGDEMVGMIHPCKIYGAIAVGRPVLLIGPRPSHAADLIDEHAVGWQVDQGDTATTIAALQQIASTSSQELTEMGRRARTAADKYSKCDLCEAYCDIVELPQKRTREHDARPVNVNDRAAELVTDSVA
jgi:glycosyltransferase involved in cell wall biosynthesis